jgi:hypothetical protein
MTGSRCEPANRSRRASTLPKHGRCSVEQLNKTES